MGRPIKIINGSGEAGPLKGSFSES